MRNIPRSVVHVIAVRHRFSMAKILVAEDEPSLYTLLEFRLHLLGHEILRANDGEQALALVESNRPDLVILDVMMPVMGGFQVLRKLKDDERTNSIPVIMLSAKGQEKHIITGLERGADDYITKPFGFPDLVDRINGVLASIK